LVPLSVCGGLGWSGWWQVGDSEYLLAQTIHSGCAFDPSHGFAYSSTRMAEMSSVRTGTDETSAELIGIGFWVRTLKDDLLPAPHELVGSMSDAMRIKIADYLSAGLKLTQYRGYSWCRFDCGIDSASMGSWDLTDGKWLWPEGLAHYVREHDVALPDEFVAHVFTGREPTMPPNPEEAKDADIDFWTQWSAQRRSARFLDGMRAARAAAHAQMVQLKLNRVAKLKETKGESKEPCLWKGCGEPSLMGTRVCAEHSLGAMDSATFDIPFYTGLQEWLRRYTPDEPTQ
jgi:hypothetical protein